MVRSITSNFDFCVFPFTRWICFDRKLLFNACCTNNGSVSGRKGQGKSMFALSRSLQKVSTLLSEISVLEL